MDRAERVHLRALRESATPGPWASESRGIVEGPDTAMVAVCGGRPTKDVALIVGAVNALPALLDDADAADARIAKAERERDEARAEVRRLRATVDTMQAQLDAHREWLATAQASGDEARAEAERLRASDASRRELMPAVLDAVRKVAREEEREACAAIATPYAARWPCAGDIVAKIRARGAGGGA